MTQFRFDIIRSGARLCSLDLLSNSTPSVRWTAAAEIKRTLSMQISGNPDINWLTDEVQVTQLADNGTEIPRGRFLVPTHPRSVDDDGTDTTSITGYDYSYILRNLSALENSLTVPAGTLVTQAVQAQLVAAGLSRSLITPSTETLLTDHVWDAGTTRYAIVQELLGEINYRDVWFDGTGIAIIEPWTPASITTAKHHYTSGKTSILTVPMQEDEDTFAAANVFVGLVSSADISTDMRAESVNDSPISPLSVMRRGRRIVSIETVDSVTSLAALQTREDNRKLRSMMSVHTYTYYTGVRDDTAPRGLNDGVILDRDGIGLLEEQDWSIECKSGGCISHTGKKVYYL